MRPAATNKSGRSGFGGFRSVFTAFGSGFASARGDGRMGPRQIIIDREHIGAYSQSILMGTVADRDDPLAVAKQHAAEGVAVTRAVQHDVLEPSIEEVAHDPVHVPARSE